ncbi:uracil-DNA glycosylase [Candidatus Micrarchaeota archaeon]|nr:uracil-DNA glycosylase [Candidatus Micrarchaeota archaeon]
MNMLSLEDVATEIRRCHRCDLANYRTCVVPGEGPADAEVMFIGEAPGREEDLSGRPFVGAAGKILDGWIRELGLTRDKVFITSVIKCRPPNNRKPTREEVLACSPYLDMQIQVIDPEVIFLLGSVALGYAVDRFNLPVERSVRMNSIAGSVFVVNDFVLGRTTLVPFYHPAYLIYNRRKTDEVNNLLNKLRVLI